jgi:hypothetical protein
MEIKPKKQFLGKDWLTARDSEVIYLYATVPISITNAYGQRVLLFIFNLRIKKG